ncbi:SCOC [Cordylochernes scorpioides]|uniref:SCOC n=1 Tax=Cordylochernes scorpioides TaxID=51811 RepID=A0ABY6LBC9_9ARAC|nr:SCOC [Cordylochernes scorpioides]
MKMPKVSVMDARLRAFNLQSCGVADDSSLASPEDTSSSNGTSHCGLQQSLESLNYSPLPSKRVTPSVTWCVSGLDPDFSPDELEEKARLISQVLELQNTLDGGCQGLVVLIKQQCVGVCVGTDLSQRVDNVKEENLKLRSENQVLGQYIENLMSASTVFQHTSR